MADFPSTALKTLRQTVSNGPLPKPGFWSKAPKIDLSYSLDPLDKAYALRALGGAATGALTGAGVGLVGPEEEKDWLPMTSIGVGALAGAAPTLIHRQIYKNKLSKIPRALRDTVNAKYVSDAFDSLKDPKHHILGGATESLVPSLLATGSLLPDASNDQEGFGVDSDRKRRRGYWRKKLKEPGGREKFEEYARTYPQLSALSRVIGSNTLRGGVAGNVLGRYTGNKNLATAAGAGLGLAADALQARYEQQYNQNMVDHIRAKEVNKKASVNVDSPVAETLAGTALGGALGAGIGHLVFKRKGLSSWGRHVGGAMGGTAGALALPSLLTDSPERAALRQRLAILGATAGGAAGSAGSAHILNKLPKLRELLKGHGGTYIPAAGAVLGAMGGNVLADHLTPYASND